MRLRKLWRAKPRLADLIRIADAARGRRDWPAAAEGYANVLARAPRNGSVWVQYGHALKESGQIEEAANAYGRAVALMPDNADAHLHYGHALKMIGKREEAIATLATALQIDPDVDSAYDELVRLGVRDRAGDAGVLAVRRRSVAAAESSARRTAEALKQAARYASYPKRSYDEFRRDFPIAPPPGRAPTGEVLVLVDALDAVPALLRSTLMSLVNQAATGWQALVIGSPAIAAHPVGSFAHVEPRIRFMDAAGELADIDPTATLVLLTAGTILDPQALSWFGMAAERTGAIVVYADHDEGHENWRDGLERWSPAFYWPYDPDFFAAAAEVPAVVLAAGHVFRSIDAAAMLDAHDGEALRRALLLAAGGHGRAAHVPRLLSTKLALPEIAFHGKADPAIPAKLAWKPARPTATLRDERIHVVVPTRDEAAMLERCVATLRERTARPDLLRITIVDNRSKNEDTRRLLTSGEAAGRFDFRSFDEPFNWSRANNLAVAGSDAGILLFLNNDTEMLTQGWDDRLRDRFEDRSIGAVGARLLYPDGAVQHAGVLLGVLDALPVHEALGADGTDPGPLGRWVTPRRVTAVTGACLGIRRDAFEQAGGFDERNLFVAYNDVDLCIRLREAGLAIVYDPLIELIHYESRSRGQAVTRSQIAWDHAERDTLHRLRGAAMLEEPSYNPHFPWPGVPFDGLREPTMTQIIQHIDRSADPFPWRPERSNPAEER